MRAHMVYAHVKLYAHNLTHAYLLATITAKLIAQALKVNTSLTVERFFHDVFHICTACHNAPL